MTQTVLITGAALRVGNAIARGFAGKGWNVIIHCNHSAEDALALSYELSSRFPEVLFPVVRADLKQPLQAADILFNKLPPGITRVDLLVNNASVFSPSTLKDTSHDLFREQFLVNMEAPFFLMQRFYNVFETGCIINIVDCKITGLDSSHAAYLLSKKSLMDLTLMAAREWAPTMRVNAVAPGPVLPPAGKGDQYLKKVAMATPLKRPVEISDLFSSIYFLATNSSVTGQVIYCDSGMNLNC